MLVVQLQPQPGGTRWDWLDKESIRGPKPRQKPDKGRYILGFWLQPAFSFGSTEPDASISWVFLSLGSIQIDEMDLPDSGHGLTSAPLSVEPWLLQGSGRLQEPDSSRGPASAPFSVELWLLWGCGHLRELAKKSNPGVAIQIDPPILK